MAIKKTVSNDFYLRSSRVILTFSIAANPVGCLTPHDQYVSAQKLPLNGFTSVSRGARI